MICTSVSEPVRVERRLTPLLLICEDLENNQTNIKCHKGNIRALDLRVKLRGEQDGVYRRGKQEEQNALHEGDEGPVEDVKDDRSHILLDKGPAIALARVL